MGYPINYKRFVNRNALHDGDSADGTDPNARLYLIRADLRRLEHDQRDEAHLADYAKAAGITPEQVQAVLDRFFEGDW